MKKIALVLSGCGFKDGSEITESVSLLIHLSKKKADITCYSLDKDIKVSSKSLESSQRNLIEESSRIYRKEVLDLKNLNSSQFDGICFPGGFGAALHLSDWALKQSKSQVHPEITRVISSFFKESKPILALCIAPVLLAKVLSGKGITLSLGNDPASIKEVESLNVKHVSCSLNDYVTDRENKIISSPCYMYDKAHFHEVFEAVGKAVSEFYEMA